MTIFLFTLPPSLNLEIQGWLAWFCGAFRPLGKEVIVIDGLNLEPGASEEPPLFAFPSLTLDNGNLHRCGH